MNLGEKINIANKGLGGLVIGAALIAIPVILIFGMT